MNSDWQILVDALRSELQEYGAICSTLDEQQKAIFECNGEKVQMVGGMLNQQIESATRLRNAREELMRDIARFNELPPETALADMRSVFPEAAQGLLKALVEEINTMLQSIRRRSRQNQMLLARTCEVMERTLQLLRPSNFVKTYSAKGAVSVHMGPVGSHIQSVG